MPASSSENFVHIEETLKSSLSGAHKKVDSQIVSSAKRVLLNKIDFKPAQKAYSLQIDSLRSKYIPLNPSHTKLSEDHESSTSSSKFFLEGSDFKTSKCKTMVS